MNFISRITATSVVILFFSMMAQGQGVYTPYDELPGIIRSYKPSYSDDLPSWGRMLYQFPANYNEVGLEFNAYMINHPGEESAIIRYYRIWDRAVASYALPDGSIELPDIGQYYSNLRESQLTARHEINSPSLTGSDWTFLGPKETFWLNESGTPVAPGPCPWQVNVYSFDVAASDNNVIYGGTETGYVNKTTNKGLSWQLTGQNYPFGGGVTAVAVHPSDPNTVFAAAGNQLHKTVNGGLTWTPLLPSGGQFYADRLRIDPVNPQKIFAASSNGLYLSTNGGTTWSQKWAAQSYDVEIRPNDNSQVFALTKTGGKFSVITSVDGGQTFQVQSAFPNNIVDNSGGLLAVTPSNPNVLLAILLSANNTPYLVKGTLAGTTWSWVLVATGGSGSFPMNNGQGYFDLALDISPVNENIILVGTTTLYKSLNGGSTFTAVGGYSGSFSIHPDIQDIKMLPNGETWVSTDGGMNFTTDNFGIIANYSPRVNGIIGSDMWGFDQGWNEDIVVGGRYHNGNTSIADFYQPKALRMGGAESPTGWVLQGKSRHVAFDDLGNGWILPQTAEGKPGGRFIFSKYPNMEEYGGRRSNLVHHPNYYNTLFLAEGTGFWRSSDMGASWELLNNFPAKMRYFQISSSNPDVFYGDLVGAGLVKSTDGGLTWLQKPSLTSPPYGTSNWKGKLFMAVSPANENVVYACLQNGTWSADIGKVFKSTDGGDTWTDWTGSLSEYMKCIVIQPDSAGNDLVYLFTNATNGKTAKVFYRKVGMSDWSLFSSNYPAGMVVNMALPFFRDGKIRVGGNGGVWESRMADTAFLPRINPWVEKPHYDCMFDTLSFDDHSILAHQGATWHWTITPQPAWIDNPDIRNPRVVLGNPGPFDVMLTVTKNGQTYTKTVNAMVSAEPCPSIYDCTNPAELPKHLWSLIYVDSEETNDPGLATMSYDGNPSSIWHTRWSTGNDPYPHEIQIDLGERYRISKFTYLPRQDGSNGWIKNYELYFSYDSLNWGTAVKTGQFENSGAPQTITFDTPKTGKFFRLVALSEMNGNPWASAAEFTMTGCVDWPTGINPGVKKEKITAFPVPTTGILNIPLPPGNSFSYRVFSSQGSVVGSGSTGNQHDTWQLSLDGCIPGLYIIQLTDDQGVVYNVRVEKR